MQKLLTDEAARLQAWGSDPAIVAAVKAQNAKRATAAQVKSLDEQWAAGKAEALVKQVTTGTCADHLRTLVAGNAGYGETFIMDNQGALVCATAKTTDYWQGDEAKWQRAFNEGKGEVFIDRPKFDDSSSQTTGADLRARARQRRRHRRDHRRHLDRQTAEVKLVSFCATA